MSAKSESFRIFIYCDDPSHAPKREPVDNFIALPGGGWHEDPPKNRVGRYGHVGAGVHLVGDKVPEPGWANDPQVANQDVRTKYVLACERTPQCRRRPRPPQEANLFPVLEQMHSLGRSEVALWELGVMLDEQARREPN